MAGDVMKELLVAILSKFDESSHKLAMSSVDKAQAEITDKEKKGQAERSKNLTAHLGAASKQIVSFTNTVLRAGEKVSLGLVTIAGAVEGAAVAGTFALARLSKEMSQAYYSSQKLGSSVKDMDAFRYASEQAGSSVAKAQAGLEELGHLRNTNPAAYVGLLQRLGVAARDAAGNLRAPAQAAMDLGPALAKLPRQMQLLFGNQLGMDDDQTLAMVRPEFLAQIAQYKEMQKKIGFDPDRAAADGAAFERVWTKMWTAVDLVSKKVQAAFFNQVGGSVDHVTDWLVKNSGRISDMAIRVGDYVLHLATSIIDLTSNFDKLSPATQRFVEILAALAAAFLVLRAGPIGAIMALAGALSFLWDDYERYKQGLPSVVDWATWEPRITAVIKGLDDLWHKIDDLSTKLTGQGGAQVAFEAFAVFMAGSWVARILGAFNAITSGWAALLARLALTNPAVLGTLAVGAVLGSGDPNKSVLAGGHPDLGPRDNDLGLPGLENEDLPENKSPSDPSRLQGAWAWLKGKLGFGDDPKVKDGIIDTAKATGEIRDILKAQKEGFGAGGGAGGGPIPGNMGYIGRVMRGFHLSGFHGKGNAGEKNWWTPERQSHAVDVLMKEAGLTEDGAKALVSRWKNVESAGGPTSVNPYSGAAGIAQGLGDRRAGYTGSFDDQLRNAARELNGSESRAKRMLNTPGQEAAGASQFERAEGYNANTGRDNFTDRTQAGMGGIVHNDEASGRYSSTGTATAQAPVPAGTSGQAVTDAQVFAARQRLKAGGRDPRDRALVDRYMREQNAPIDPAHQKLADAMKAVSAGAAAPGLPRLGAPLGLSSASLYRSYDQSRSTSVSPTVNQKVTINGVQDPAAISHHLKHHAKRGVQDSLRNMQGQST